MGKPQIVIDLDGTVLTDTWPKLGTWMPGAQEALRQLSTVARVLIFSCRFSPYEMSGGPREPQWRIMEINSVRAMLDDAGLYTVEIYTREGKPTAVAYVDNKAVRYPGRPGSWKAITPKLMLMCGAKPEDIDNTGEVHGGTRDHPGDAGALWPDGIGGLGSDPIRKAHEVQEGVGAQ